MYTVINCYPQLPIPNFIFAYIEHGIVNRFIVLWQICFKHLTLYTEGKPQFQKQQKGIPGRHFQSLDVRGQIHFYFFLTCFRHFEAKLEKIVLSRVSIIKREGGGGSEF